jgi:hypothetical protein
MIERRDDGSPVPDGRVTIEIARGLADVWDPCVPDVPPLYKIPQQTYVWDFKDINFLRETVMFFCIVFPKTGERANTILRIPWGQILAIQVDKNSDEYAEAAREFNDNKPDEFYDTRFGGTCIACASRGGV